MGFVKTHSTKPLVLAPWTAIWRAPSQPPSFWYFNCYFFCTPAHPQLKLSVENVLFESLKKKGVPCFSTVLFLICSCCISRLFLTGFSSFILQPIRSPFRTKGKLGKPAWDYSGKPQKMLGPRHPEMVWVFFYDLIGKFVLEALLLLCGASIHFPKQPLGIECRLDHYSEQVLVKCSLDLMSTSESEGELCLSQELPAWDEGSLLGWLWNELNAPLHQRERFCQQRREVAQMSHTDSVGQTFEP